MKKIVLALCIVFLNFCSLNQKSIRVAELPHVPVDYEVLGDTSAEEKRESVFGIDWAHLFSDQQAQTDSAGLNPPFPGMGPTLEMAAKNGALYKGLQKIPEADKLVEPRWQIDSLNVIIYKTVTVKMWAKAIKYTRSAPITIGPPRPPPEDNLAPKKK